MDTIAVLGAGLLGAGFVERMLELGHPVRVWNRTASKLDALVAKGAVRAETPGEAVHGAVRVHFVLSEDDAVDAVLAACRGHLGAGVAIYDHSTNLPERVAARVPALRAAGIAYIPAPVFMGPANARAGNGIMLLACPESERDAHIAALVTTTGKVWWTGERADSAAVYKLLGNSMIIGIAGVIGDASQVAAAAGLPPNAVSALIAQFNPGMMLPVIPGRIANSHTSPASFTLEMARKDVRLMIETGGAENLQVLPGIAAGMDRAIAAGDALKDFAIFARRG
jgi:3-hydroxyisobutyrate dehydrogenase